MLLFDQLAPSLMGAGGTQITQNLKNVITAMKQRAQLRFSMAETTHRVPDPGVYVLSHRAPFSLRYYWTSSPFYNK